MASLNDIYNFISDVSGVRIDKLQPDSDLRDDLGIEGDDFFELEAEFEKKFSVDMSNYRWYFHHGEEGGPSIGRLLFSPPYSRVKRICVTPELLLESANAHQWLINYPEHQLTSPRWDILFDQIFFGTIAIVGSIILVLKWLYA